MFKTALLGASLTILGSVSVACGTYDSGCECEPTACSNCDIPEFPNGPTTAATVTADQNDSETGSTTTTE